MITTHRAKSKKKAPETPPKEQGNPRVYKEGDLRIMVQHVLQAAANTAVNVINKSPIANSDAAMYMKQQMMKEIPVCTGIVSDNTPRADSELDRDPPVTISLDNGKTTSLPASSFTTQGHCIVCGRMGEASAPFGSTSSIKHDVDCVVGNAIHAAYEKMSGRTIMKG